MLGLVTTALATTGFLSVVASRAKRSSACQGNFEIALKPNVIASFPTISAPEAIAARTGHEILVMHANRRSLTLLLGGKPARGSSPLEEDLTTVGTDGSYYFAATSRHVYKVTPATLKFDVRPLLRTARGEIRSIAISPSRMYVVSALDSLAFLSVFKRADNGTFKLVAVRDLPGDARVQVGVRGPIVALSQTPYTLMQLNNRLKLLRSWSATSDADFTALVSGDFSALYSIGAIPVDCGHVLQTFTNLRTGARVLTVIDIVEGRVLRKRTTAQPVGIVQRIPNTLTLIGAVEVPGGRSVVTFEWRRHKTSNLQKGRE